MSRLAEENDLDPTAVVEDVDGPSRLTSDLGDRDGSQVELLASQVLDEIMTPHAYDHRITELVATTLAITATSHLELSPV